MKCKICNDDVTVREAAMHFKWKHDNLTTEEYVINYGEFRAKKIQENNLKHNSTHECKICNIKMSSNRQLMYHITKTHKDISKEKYIVKYLLNNIAPLCKCGCGKETKIIPNNYPKYHVDYIKGHWDWIKPGYHKHDESTKEKMRLSALNRIKKDKEENKVSPWHTKDALIKKNKNNWEKIQERIKVQHNIVCLNVSPSLSKTNQKAFKFKCQECDYEWEQISFYPRCHKCNPPSYFGSSLEEKELTEYLKSINGNVILNSRNIIHPLEIDIYFPDLKIGIEYNGLYWHSEKCGKYSDYHINKTKECEKQGIRLIHIYSDEWLNKKDIVKKKLKSILCKEKETKLHARKCIVKEIPAGEKNIFLNQHHIQGEDRSKIKLGLYSDNILVAAMTFSNPRISLGQKQPQKNVYELSRFASSQYIAGGSSKLLSHFTQRYSPDKIYSYSDNRWTDPNNNMYLKLGFTRTSCSSPGYYYTNDYITRIHRYNFNKGILTKMGADISKTEKDIMDEMGYTRIWDCGSTKYEIYFNSQ